MQTVTPRPMTDPRELRVIVLMVKEGFEPKEVCKRLRISQATFYRRVAEIRQLEKESRQLKAES